MIKGYASYFVSYLITELKDLSNINSIILFGSAARDETTKDSDVDIFIDVNKADKKFGEKIKKIEEGFYKSREALLFKAKGVDNKINVVVGLIDKWPDLKKSIESYGLVLYGPYISKGVKGRKYVIIFWDGVRKNRGAFLNKLYGFKTGGKAYKGLIEQLEGRRIGKSSVMLPVEHREEIFKLIKKYGVNARVFEVYE